MNATIIILLSIALVALSGLQYRTERPRNRPDARQELKNDRPADAA